MIYEFTSTANRKNYGLVISQDEIGAHVLFDEFQVDRKVSLPVRYRYVALAGSKYVVNQPRREILPLGSHVRWNSGILSNLARRMAADGWHAEDEDLSQYYA